MKIRSADLEKDALAIMDGARDFRSRVGFQTLFPEDDEGFVEAVGKIVSMEPVTVLVATKDEKVVAGICFFISPFLWNPDRLVAEELFWWASKDAPFKAAYHVMEHAMAYIDLQGAVPLFKSLTTSPKGVDKIYRRFGLKPMETLYARI